MVAIVPLQHVRRQDGFLAEGHLYAHGERFFLVFTAGDRRTWDACVSDVTGGHMADYLVRSAPSRDACVERLQHALDA